MRANDKMVSICHKEKRFLQLPEQERTLLAQGAWNYVTSEAQMRSIFRVWRYYASDVEKRGMFKGDEEPDIYKVQGGRRDETKREIRMDAKKDPLYKSIP